MFYNIKAVFYSSYYYYYYYCEECGGDNDYDYDGRRIRRQLQEVLETVMLVYN